MSLSSNTIRNRIFILKWISLSIFLLYGSILFYLQIVRGYIYSEQIRKIHQRDETLHARRGRIFDRSLKIIADNRYLYEVYLSLPAVTDEQIETLIPHLAQLFAIPSAQLRERITAAQKNNSFNVILAERLDLRKIAYLIEHHTEFPGIGWRNSPLRYYPHKDTLVHVGGYVGQISPEEWQRHYNQAYSHNAIIGKSGVEQIYDSTLRGKDGQKITTVDALSNIVEVNNVIDPIDGHDIILTIDTRIQQLAWDALGNRIGTVLVLKPGSGEILAMASYPSFDPNRLYERNSEGYLEQLHTQPYSPFINRAIQSSYPPASTFKILMAAAIIEERAFPINSRINCIGYFRLGNTILYEWDRRNFGFLNIFGALANSSNVYFWTVSTKYLGVEHIVNYSYQFGLGKKSGIDLPHEVTGIVPDPEWKRRTFNERWTAGDTANLAIGQGYLNTTPLQMANLISAISNNGRIYRPHVLKEIRDAKSGSILSQTEPEIIADIDVNPSTVKHVKQGLRGVISNGTGHAVITTDIVPIAGKTGTSEVIKGKNRYHSWFVAYAPVDAPVSEQVVVIVFIDAKNEWEWWAPKAANIILHGIFSGSDYRNTVSELRRSPRGLWYL